MQFSSANSINWGRLVPQIVYYISAYCDLLADGKLKMGDTFNVVVPTGNFGNILAAYYAKEMGLPVARLICASNRNRVLTDFLATGTYDRNRPFYPTTSPSMDILISSNLERLLCHLAGRDDAVIRTLMQELASKGVYTVPEGVKEKLTGLFDAGWCDDAGTAAAIADTYEKYGYLCDTHTAVGMKVYGDYRARTGDITPTVIASTANPYKFSASVLAALGRDAAELDEFDKVEALQALTGCPVPPPLAGLRGKTPASPRCAAGMRCPVSCSICWTFDKSGMECAHVAVRHRGSASVLQHVQADGRVRGWADYTARLEKNWRGAGRAGGHRRHRGGYLLGYGPPGSGGRFCLSRPSARTGKS